jgi:hypothetical protein
MKKLFLFIAFGYLMMGCRALYKPETLFHPDYDLKRYRSFALLFDESKSKDTIDMQQAVGKEIIYQMGLRGYTESFNNADVAIRFDMFPKDVRLLDFEENTFVRSINSRVYYGRTQHFARRGTLLVRVYDLKSKELIWITYLDHINRAGAWTPNLMQIKTKNIFLYYPFRKK